MRSLGSINPDTMVSCFFPYSKINRRGHKAENISRNRSFEEEVYVGGREGDGGKIGYEERSITQPPFLFFSNDSWSAGNIELSSSFFERSRFDLSTYFGVQSRLEFCFAIKKGLLFIQ